MITVELVLLDCMKWEQIDSFIALISSHLFMNPKRTTQDRFLKRSDLEFKWTWNQHCSFWQLLSLAQCNGWCCQWFTQFWEITFVTYPVLFHALCFMLMNTEKIMEMPSDKRLHLGMYIFCFCPAMGSPGNWVHQFPVDNIRYGTNENKWG